jgi:alkane 1-monooxygenase
MRAGADEHQPAKSLPAWPFDVSLYVLVALQIINIVGILHLASVTGLATVDAWVAVVQMGVTSGYSGIVVAHELIHRRERKQQLLGRLLLSLVL